MNFTSVKCKNELDCCQIICQQEKLKRGEIKMSAFVIFSSLILERELHAEEAVSRRILRYHSNPLDVPDFK